MFVEVHIVEEEINKVDDFQPHQFITVTIAMTSLLIEKYCFS